MGATSRELVGMNIVSCRKEVGYMPRFFGVSKKVCVSSKATISEICPSVFLGVRVFKGWKKVSKGKKKTYDVLETYGNVFGESPKLRLAWLLQDSACYWFYVSFLVPDANWGHCIDFLVATVRESNVIGVFFTFTVKIIELKTVFPRPYYISRFSIFALFVSLLLAESGLLNWA